MFVQSFRSIRRQHERSGCRLWFVRVCWSTPSNIESRQSALDFQPKTRRAVDLSKGFFFRTRNPIVVEE